LGAVVSAGWNAWIRDLVPEARRGRFFARRLTVMTLVGIVISLAAAAFVDIWGSHFPESKILAYSILLAIAFLAGLASV
jgi:MFS family permease